MGNKSYSKATLRGLAQDADSGVRRVDAYRVDPRFLQIEEGFNVRIKDDPELRAHIDSIKESIKAHIAANDPECRVWEGGLLDVIEMIIVRVTNEGDIYVVEGYSRTTAIRELITEGWDIKEVDVAPTKEDEAGRVVVMVRSSQGKSLAPVERAEAYRRLVDDHGWSFPEIATRCGGTPQRVEQLVLLGRAPERIRDLVAQKKITADSAIEIIRKHRDNPDDAVSAIEALVAGKDGAKPVGKAQVRASIPQKVQEHLFTALRGDKGLSRQLKTIEGSGDGWEDRPIAVNLPAGVLKQLLEQQPKVGAGDKASAKK